MGKIIKFRKRRRDLPGSAYAAIGLGLGAIIGMGIIAAPMLSLGPAAEALGLAGTTASAKTRAFNFCHTGGGTNCVVDGDTIWLDGEKVRMADIDAPETHPPRCRREAELGERATRRLHELVNAGPLEAVPVGSRDADRYGRKLRVLMRDGQSLGEVLVSEGLARTWDGARRPWC